MPPKKSNISTRAGSTEEGKQSRLPSGRTGGKVPRAAEQGALLTPSKPQNSGVLNFLRRKPKAPPLVFGASQENPWFRRSLTPSDFYLTQRVNVRTFFGDEQTGFDKEFSMDRMGSREYEGNMAQLSLRSMRAHGPAVTRPFQVEFNGTTHDLYFVGPETLLDAEIPVFDEWLHLPEPTPFKENPRFKTKLRGEADDRYNPDAWWAFRAGVMWTLDEDIAEQLADSVNSHTED